MSKVGGLCGITVPRVRLCVVDYNQQLGTVYQLKLFVSLLMEHMKELEYHRCSFPVKFLPR